MGVRGDLQADLAAEAKGLKRGVKEVVLTASQVASARDIEEAIDQATDDGTQPGIVTLEARAGEFFYMQPDHFRPTGPGASRVGLAIVAVGDAHGPRPPKSAP